jgi:hypothetical protein
MEAKSLDQASREQHKRSLEAYLESDRLSMRWIVEILKDALSRSSISSFLNCERNTENMSDGSISQRFEGG